MELTLEQVIAMLPNIAPLSKLGDSYYDGYDKGYLDAIHETEFNIREAFKKMEKQ